MFELHRAAAQISVAMQIDRMTLVNFLKSRTKSFSAELLVILLYGMCFVLGFIKETCTFIEILQSGL